VPQRLGRSSLAGHLAQLVLDTRSTVGWSQRELSERSGICQSTICRIETGRFGSLSVTNASTLLDTLGLTVRVTADAPFLIDRMRQREPAHSRCSGSVRRNLERDGWVVEQEVEIGTERVRGWIDVIAFHPGGKALLVIEIKTELHDIGATQRTMAWYEREAWSVARRCGWEPQVQGALLLVLKTRANDLRLRENRELIDQAFPTRATALSRWLGNADGSRLAFRGLAMIDPLSRHRAWLHPTKLDGRRVEAPYADYADFMRRLEARRRR